VDKQRKRERFLRDSVQIRLGGIAADLARIDAFSNNPLHGEVVLSMIDDSKHLCEWAGLDAAPMDIKTTHALLILQRQLVKWQYHFDDIYADPVRRAEMAETARAWSNHLLVLSGLLTKTHEHP